MGSKSRADRALAPWAWIPAQAWGRGSLGMSPEGPSGTQAHLPQNNGQNKGWGAFLGPGRPSPLYSRGLQTATLSHPPSSPKNSISRPFHLPSKMSLL